MNTGKELRIIWQKVIEMPYTRDQLKIFGIALSMKRGKTPYDYSDTAAEIARSTSAEALENMIAEGVKKKSIRIGG